MGLSSILCKFLFFERDEISFNPLFLYTNKIMTLSFTLHIL